MEFNKSCLPGCSPEQIVNLNWAFNIEDINNITIYNADGCAYETSELEYAYSVDNVCWSCYMTYDEMLENTIGLKQDFFVRFSVAGAISKIEIDGEEFADYTTSLKSGFKFTACDNTTNSTNLWNPYANVECALKLQQQMAENIACMIGIPIYYFKLTPNKGSKDITFKEYTLMDVEAVKQIKLVVADGQMPSSKPEFNDWGLEWQTDWECEITKGMFATAFGNTAQPMEGDLIYIPMMKRMWMVNEAYEEKKEAFMWNATTFKVALVKYQEKDSVDLGETEQLVNTFVKNKYEDLFGDEDTLESGIELPASDNYKPDNLYAVYQSDSTRKSITVETVNNVSDTLYQKGTLLSDLQYILNEQESTIVYQRKFCGKNGSISFIINPLSAQSEITGNLISIGNIKLNYTQTDNKFTLSLNLSKKISISLYTNVTYFILFRWSKTLNTIELFAYQYKHPDMPLYKLQPHHYYFDIDNPYAKSISKYNIEMEQTTKGEISVHNFVGKITNIKVFDMYNTDISEMLQMYPTNQHLLVNDTARKLLDLNGFSNR